MDRTGEGARAAATDFRGEPRDTNRPPEPALDPRLGPGLPGQDELESRGPGGERRSEGEEPV